MEAADAITDAADHEALATSTYPFSLVTLTVMSTQHSSLLAIM